MEPQHIKKIGILTSGGDGPGMNAAIRSVTRSALSKGLKVAGIIRGFQGLIYDDVTELDHRSVSNIITRGGTILKTARCPEFKEEAGQKKAVETLKKHKIDALVVIGGDGSYRGAQDLFSKYGVPAMGLPGTIDNDLCGTDQTIGCRTAVDTALEAIDKVRDTAHSMERIFVIEVMGNKSGYIAGEVALAAGAEDLIVPERRTDFDKICKNIVAGNKKGKISWMIIVAEGAAHAGDVANTITTITSLETRYVVLGHVQRGGSPVGADRILATRLGAAAVDLLLEGRFGQALGVIEDEINILPLKQACRREFSHLDEYFRLLEVLR